MGAGILASAKDVIVESIGLGSLLLAGVALILIESWGVKKIWRLLKKSSD